MCARVCVTTRAGVENRDLASRARAIQSIALVIPRATHTAAYVAFAQCALESERFFAHRYSAKEHRHCFAARGCRMIFDAAFLRLFF